MTKEQQDEVAQERVLLGDSLSLIARAYMYAACADVGSKEFKALMSLIAHEVNNVVTYTNNIGVLVGNVDPTNPANQAYFKAVRELNKLSGRS